MHNNVSLYYCWIMRLHYLSITTDLFHGQNSHAFARLHGAPPWARHCVRGIQRWMDMATVLEGEDPTKRLSTKKALRAESRAPRALGVKGEVNQEEWCLP